jgi:phosphate transport system substrate-binding protein
VISTSTRRLGALALASAMLVGACAGGGSDSPAPTDGGTSPTQNPGGGDGVSGSIFVTGSSTVEPISSGVAEMFKDENPGFDFTVEGPGTGDGFAKFCNGEADISDASRKIKDEEAANCAANNIEYVELKVAIDGISVLTSTENDAVACLSFNDLYALLGPESTGKNNWSDAQGLAAELGSTTQFPSAPLVITAPGEESGTYDSFIELVIAKIADSRDQPHESRPDYTASANDNAIVEGIAGTPTSLGWVGFAFYEENVDKLKAIAIDKAGDGTCVDPTAESIADNSYPISRNLYIYVNTAKAAENEALVAYVDYYMAPGTIAEVLQTVPYVNIPEADLDASRAAWEGR